MSSIYRYNGKRMVVIDKGIPEICLFQLDDIKAFLYVMAIWPPGQIPLYKISLGQFHYQETQTDVIIYDLKVC